MTKTRSPERLQLMREAMPQIERLYVTYQTDKGCANSIKAFRQILKLHEMVKPKNRDELDYDYWEEFVPRFIYESDLSYRESYPQHWNLYETYKKASLDKFADDFVTFLRSILNVDEANRSYLWTQQLAEDIRKIVTEMDSGRRIKALEQQNTELRMQVSQLESLLEERYHRTQSHILGIEQLLSQLNASILHSLLERSVTSPQEGK